MARLSLLVLLACLSLEVARADDASDTFFELKIRPVLARRACRVMAARRPKAG